MNYFIECRNVLSRKDLLIYNDEFEEIGEIKYHKQNSDYNISCMYNLDSKKYLVKTNPLKFKPKYIIYDEGGNQVAKISAGVKIIHSIIEADKYYFVKSAFWKIKYQVYDKRRIIATLEVNRIKGKRYFKITSLEGGFLTPLSLFLLAQAVRIKAIIN
ncbi:hypothetical protein KQ51_00763 [Candidatus Izimaplasma bacterium HR1]|jgi:hypothetical protein|uniref:hypothetical protein n=1 Tax=Candidatus Izimoplasma sp. HR1 TaxID=1541959 RepID=UPI0004F6965F|nr:hypothetical protein KQ51_00763 [Candidatus Izimaplasma bacterium HR1]